MPGAVEEGVDPRGEQDDTDAGRPAHREKRLVKAIDRHLQLRYRGSEVNAEDRKDHIQHRHRDEEQRLEGLVREAVPAHLLVGPEERQDRKVRLEVDGRNHESGREGQAEPQPVEQEGRLQLPAETGDAPCSDHDREEDAAEGVAGGVSPEVVGDAHVEPHPEQRQADQDAGLDDYRDRLVPEAPGRVERASEDVGVSVQDHGREGRREQAFEAVDRKDSGQRQEPGDG